MTGKDEMTGMSKRKILAMPAVLAQAVNSFGSEVETRVDPGIRAESVIFGFGFVADGTETQEACAEKCATELCNAIQNHPGRFLGWRRRPEWSYEKMMGDRYGKFRLRARPLFEVAS